ncbi:MAG: iron transporter [Verrucomicrobiales bacterium]|nr:iron transporter [Verrucomicrobiales bacterium]|tara:strand:+ start:2227 stop:3588 length:1362 start_codon:yes stop_codon:yes gene_type:complete
MSVDHAQPQDAPTHWGGIFKHLGPGLIVTACIVGSGELIATPKVGADHGFSLLWFIIIGCIIKVFVQVELGRAAVANGKTTLQLMNAMPGPRLVVSWLVWCWLFMYVAVFFQLGGIVGGVAQVFGELNWIPKGGEGFMTPDKWLAVGVSVATAAILASGKYRTVERFSVYMVVFFTLSTVYALVMLQTSPAMGEYAITGDQIREGLRFQLPDDFSTAFAAFGIIGVGATELIYYPYWCLEKGYSRNVGPREDSEAWYSRARGWLRVMRIDAWVSMVIYTSATVVFYLLGAAFLRKTGLSEEGMIVDLSKMFAPLGKAGFTIFLVGAFVVLFSTLVSGTASNARLLADGLVLYKVRTVKDESQWMELVRKCCIGIPLVCGVLYCVMGAPVAMVLIGGVAQALMLPFLAAAALYFRYQKTDPPLQPGNTWTLFLWISALAMAAVGVFQLITKIFG